jgi:hypothetical protein
MDNGEALIAAQDADWINYTATVRGNINSGTPMTLNPPPGTPHWLSIYKDLKPNVPVENCYKCNVFDNAAYSAPMFDYSRCDKIEALYWASNSGFYYQVPVIGVIAMVDRVLGSYDLEYYWNNTFFGQETNLTSRHSFNNPDLWNFISNNTIYQDPDTNTSYYYTFHGTRLELNSTWM